MQFLGRLRMVIQRGRSVPGGAVGGDARQAQHHPRQGTLLGLGVRQGHRRALGGRPWLHTSAHWRRAAVLSSGDVPSTASSHARTSLDC